MPRRPSHELNPAIEYGRIRLRIYQVEDAQLKLIEQGPPENTYLSFSLFLLGSALSFTTSLLTTEIESDRTFVIFVVMTTFGWVIGILLFVLWFRSRGSVKSITAVIRQQLPPEGEQEAIAIVLPEGN